ncbi:MAG: Maf family protein [bacterium]
MAKPTIILASTSQSRQTLLHNAGVQFDAIDAGVDEDAIKKAFLGDGNEQDIADVATILAQTKAVTVSEQQPDQLVIGADQTLLCDGKLYSKPESIEHARGQLLYMAGRTHVLETAVACATNGQIVWSYREGPSLKMRDFTPQFLGRYMAAVGADVTSTVGGYKLEGQGIQLFEKIEGNYFSILGLPLLPLLDFLRQQELLYT